MGNGSLLLKKYDLAVGYQQVWKKNNVPSLKIAKCKETADQRLIFNYHDLIVNVCTHMPVYHCHKPVLQGKWPLLQVCYKP